MIIAFYIFLFLYIFVYLTKLLLIVVYIKKNDTKTEVIDENKFTIIQPLVSGDEALEQKLIENLEKSGNIKFKYLIDYNDDEIKNITSKIKEKYGNRIEIVEVGEIPENLNRKTYKMKYSLKNTNEYFIALDDDTTIDAKQIGKIKNLLENEKIIATGIPYYKTGKGFYSNLVATFVNSNSLYTYLGLSSISPLKTVNGMFYVTKTEYLRELDAFKNIEDKLCDELELALLFSKNGYKILQTTIPCEVTTTVKCFTDYINLMKRWLVFAMHYMKEDFSFKIFTLGFLTVFLPLTTFVISLFAGIKFLIIYLGIHLLKSTINYLYRRKVFGIKEKLYVIPLEIITDFLQTFHCLHSIFSPNKIIWRGHEIDINKKEIRVN